MIAWYIVPYKRENNPNQVIRYCAIDDHTPEIVASGGKWSETEIDGDKAIVKVKTSEEVLAKLDTEYKRIKETKGVKDVEKLMTATRKKPRYDKIADKIIFDGEEVPCKPIEEVDREVQ